MKPIHILALLVAYVATLSAVLGYLGAHGVQASDGSVIVTTLIGNLLAFWWYVADSSERGYQRPPLLGVAVIAAATLAIPYYLLRSRTKGQKLEALGRFVGFLFALVAIAFVATLPFVAVG